MGLPPISELLKQYGGGTEQLPSIAELMQQYGVGEPPPAEPGFYDQIKGYGAEAYDFAKPVLRPLQGLLNVGGAGAGLLASGTEAYERAQQANLEGEGPAGGPIEALGTKAYTAPGLGQTAFEALMPGPQEGWAAVGKTVGSLAGDILTDPLTYAGGLGLAGQLTKADDVSKAFRMAKYGSEAARPVRAAAAVLGSPTAGLVYGPEAIRGAAAGFEQGTVAGGVQGILLAGLSGLMGKGVIDEFTAMRTMAKAKGEADPTATAEPPFGPIFEDPDAPSAPPPFGPVFQPDVPEAFNPRMYDEPIGPVGPSKTKLGPPKPRKPRAAPVEAPVEAAPVEAPIRVPPAPEMDFPVDPQRVLPGDLAPMTEVEKFADMYRRFQEQAVAEVAEAAGPPQPRWHGLPRPEPEQLGLGFAPGSTPARPEPVAVEAGPPIPVEAAPTLPEVATHPKYGQVQVQAIDQSGWASVVTTGGRQLEIPVENLKFAAATGRQTPVAPPARALTPPSFPAAALAAPEEAASATGGASFRQYEEPIGPRFENRKRRLGPPAPRSPKVEVRAPEEPQVAMESGAIPKVAEEGRPYSSALDKSTLNHLDAWLDRAAHADERDALRARIIKAVEEDPGLVDRGWPAIRDMTEGPRKITPEEAVTRTRLGQQARTIAQELGISVDEVREARRAGGIGDSDAGKIIGEVKKAEKAARAAAQAGEPAPAPGLEPAPGVPAPAAPVQPDVLAEAAQVAAPAARLAAKRPPPPPTEAEAAPGIADEIMALAEKGEINPDTLTPQAIADRWGVALRRPATGRMLPRKPEERYQISGPRPYPEPGILQREIAGETVLPTRPKPSTMGEADLIMANVRERWDRLKKEGKTPDLTNPLRDRTPVMAGFVQGGLAKKPSKATREALGEAGEEATWIGPEKVEDEMRVPWESPDTRSFEEQVRDEREQKRLEKEFPGPPRLKEQPLGDLPQPKLSIAEQQGLFQRLADGDESALPRLMYANEGFIHRAASMFRMLEQTGSTEAPKLEPSEVARNAAEAAFRRLGQRVAAFSDPSHKLRKFAMNPKDITVGTIISLLQGPRTKPGGFIGKAGQKKIAQDIRNAKLEPKGEEGASVAEKVAARRATPIETKVSDELATAQRELAGLKATEAMEKHLDETERLVLTMKFNGALHEEIAKALFERGRVGYKAKAMTPQHVGKLITKALSKLADTPELKALAERFPKIQPEAATKAPKLQAEKISWREAGIPEKADRASLADYVEGATPERIQAGLRRMLDSGSLTWLRDYADHLGITHDPRDGTAGLTRKIQRRLGLEYLESEAPATKEIAPVGRGLETVKLLQRERGVFEIPGDHPVRGRLVEDGPANIWTVSVPANPSRAGLVDGITRAVDDLLAHPAKDGPDYFVLPGDTPMSVARALIATGKLRQVVKGTRPLPADRIMLRVVREGDPSATINMLGGQSLIKLADDLVARGLPRALDALDHGLDLFAAGVRGGLSWSKEMVRRFGDGIKKFLREIYSALNPLFKRLTEAGKEAAATPEAGGFGHVYRLLKAAMTPTVSAAGPKEAVVKQVEAKRPIKPIKPMKLAAPEIETEFKQTRPQGPLPPAKPQGIPDVYWNRFRNIMADENAVQDTILLSQMMNPKLARATPETFAAWTSEVNKLLGEATGDDIIEAIIRKGGAVSPAQHTALRSVANTIYNQMSDARTKYLEAQATGSQEAITNAWWKLEQSLGKAQAVLEVASGNSTRAGRVLASYRVKIGEIDPLTSQEGRLRSAFTARGITKDKHAELVRLWQANDFGNFRQKLALAEQPGIGRKILEFWKASMLGPPSMVANFSSNTLFHGLRLAERNMGALWDKYRVQLFHGGDDEFRTQFVLPMALRAKAYRMAFGEAGARMFQDHLAILKGEPLEVRQTDINPFSDVNLSSWSGAIKGRKGEFFRSSFKSLSSTDRFFKTLTQYNELFERAYARARQQKVPAADMERFIADRVHGMLELASNERFQGRMLRDHPDTFKEMSAEWDQIAAAMDRDTFQSSLKGIFRNMAEVTEKTKLMEIVLPFVKTPSNIALETWRRTPMGFLLLARRYDEVIGKREGGLIQEGDWRAFQEEVAKPLMGTAIMGGVMALASEGGISGGGPTDPELEQTLRASGWQPYSVKIGNQWISYQRLEPLSSILGMAADVAEGWRMGDMDSTTKAGSRLLASLSENLTNKTFLAGLEGLFTAWHDPKRYGDRLVRQLAGSAVPNTIGYLPFGQLARAIDPTIRETKGSFTAPFQAKIPFASRGLPAQHDPTGGERKRPGSFPERLASPLARSQEKAAEGDVARELVRIDYPPGLIPKSLKVRGRKIQLTTEEHEKLVASRRDATAALLRVINDPSYKRLPDNDDDPDWRPGRRTKQEVLQRVYSRYLQRAKAQVNPQAFRRYRQEQQGARP